MKLGIAVLALVTVLATPAQGAADVDAGRAKSLACQACHGANGMGTAPDIPNLAGQQAKYLQSQLSAFRAGDRKHDLMNAIAKQLSDSEIENLAAFWSSMPAGGTVTADPAAEFRKSRLNFPANFPKDFVVYAEHKGDDGKVSSKSYVTRPAIAAARAGKALPNDTAIVVESYKDGAVASYAALGSHAGWGEGIPDLLRNGDWSFAVFDAQKARRDINYARCLACHKPKAETSYVFGYADIAKAP